MTPGNFASPMAQAAHSHVESMRVAQKDQQEEQKRAGEQPLKLETVEPRDATEPIAATSNEAKAPYVSNIGILASSMPYYHKEYMKQRRNDAAQRRAQEAARQQHEEAEDEGEPLEPSEAAYFSRLSLDPNPKEQLTPEQRSNLQRLKPHSRSTIQLQKLIAEESENPEAAATANRKRRRTSVGNSVSAAGTLPTTPCTPFIVRSKPTVPSGKSILLVGDLSRSTTDRFRPRRWRYPLRGVTLIRFTRQALHCF